MKLDMKSSNGLIVAMLLIVAVAIGFWVLGVSPKREEAAKLDKQVSKFESDLVLHEGEVLSGEEARREFPTAYERLIVLGKAVPSDDETASLIVQINHIAERNGIEFQEFKLNSEGSEEPEAATSAQGASPTEATAALLPLGATVGPAGLAVMPYSLTFHGSFFKLADFIEEVDSLVKTENEDVLVDGRLLTLDGFALEADSEKGFPALEAKFAITTYTVPPGQEATAEAAPTSPETAEAAPASATIGATP